MSELFAWKLKTGAIVHPECREPFANGKTGHAYPAIESALYPGYPMPEGRFQICRHCEAPIWESANRKAGRGLHYREDIAQRETVAGR